jgi:hypothetical protein
MRRSLSSCLRPRHLGVTIATSLCAGAMLATPSISPVYAAPTVGGDENGPQVQILQPGYQDVLKGKTKILIAVKAQKFNPQFVEMFIDDKPATTGPISLSTLPSAQYDWDTKLFSDGPHKLTVRITDTQGFRGWAEVNVYINNNKKVDSLPPSLKWDNVDGYQQLSGEAQIQLQAVDNFGVKWIIVSVNPASEPNRKPALRSWLLNRPPYTVKFDTTKVDDGLYQLSAKAWDSFDQEGTADTLTIGVVNTGGINGTTVGEMLSGMRKMDSAKPVATKPSAPRFTLDTPDAPSTSPNIYTQRSGETKAAATPSKVIVKSGGKAGGAATKTPLQPSAPAMIVRDTKPSAKPPTLVAKNSAEAATEVASPRLSTSASVAAKTAPSTLQGEIGGAIDDDWRTRLARLATPTTEADTDSSGALLSAPSSGKLNNDSLSISRPSGSSVASAIESGTAAARVAMPEGEMRDFTSSPSLDPSGEKPVLSQKSDGNMRVAAKDPLQIESGAPAPTGRLSNPPRVAARPEKLEVAGPALSSPQPRTVAPAATRVAAAPAIGKEASIPSRVASPTVGAPRRYDGAQFSVAPTPSSAPRTQLSAKVPVETKTSPSKGAAAARVANPDAKRIAALPRPFKTGQTSAINAITVSPVEVKTSDAIPAFHVAARATDLRAVAARYGLPVAVVAACNDWSQDKVLVAGDKVKLPQQLKISYQGVPVKSDAPSMLVGGTSVTAFRFLFEQAGGKLVWDAKKQRVIAKKGNSEVILTIGSNKAKVGDEEIMMELAAFLFEGRTMVPVRFFEEGLRAQVEWDPQTGRLVVAMAN